MIQMPLTIEGMVCDMCEAHLNDAIHCAFSVKKVISSHRKGEPVIIAESEPAEADLRKAIAPTQRSDEARVPCQCRGQRTARADAL